MAPLTVAIVIVIIIINIVVILIRMIIILLVWYLLDYGKCDTPFYREACHILCGAFKLFELVYAATLL